MTMPGFVLSAVLFAGALWLFWWLVELTGGVAGHAFTVARSISSGVSSWVVGRYGGHHDSGSPARSSALQAASDPDSGRLDGADELTVEPTTVRRDRRRPRA